MILSQMYIVKLNKIIDGQEILKILAMEDNEEVMRILKV
jgi:hypothetical protein